MLGIRLAAMHEEAVRKGLLPKRQMTGSSADLGSMVSSLTSEVLGGGTTTTATSSPTASDTTAAATTAATPTDTAATTTSGASPVNVTETSSSNGVVETTSPTSASPSTTTATPATTSSAPNTSNSSIVVVDSATINRSSLTTATVVSSPLVSVSTEAVVYVTDYSTDGHVVHATVTSNRLHSTTTGYTASTIEPALANGGSSGGSNSGLSDSSKKIVGGVVGGVGGAIFVGALAVLFLRLYARRRRNQLFSEHDDFNSSVTNGSTHRSKSPFDRHSTPTSNAPVTAASNF